MIIQVIQRFESGGLSLEWLYHVTMSKKAYWEENELCGDTYPSIFNCMVIFPSSLISHFLSGHIFHFVIYKLLLKQMFLGVVADLTWQSKYF